MLASLRITETFSETEIDDVDIVLLLADTNQEVIGLYISVEEVSRVHEFNSLKLI